MSWTYSSTNVVTGFGIERATSANGPWTEIGTVAAPTTNYEDAALQYSTTYYYQIFAYNSTGDSPDSSTASYTTPAPPSTPPTITTQPASQTVNVGANVTFTVAASGTAPMTYQWLYNGGNLTGQTGSTLSLSQVQQSQAGNYSVIVSNAVGTATSTAAVLTVNNVAPTITTQPASQTVNVGANVTFTVAASGTAPMTYQWLYNGVNLTGQTGSTLSLSQVQQSQAGNYSVVVSNVVGTATSATAVLTVNNVAPTITTQPASQTVNVGANVTFTVAASGTAPMTYQWLYNGGNLTGQTASTLSLSQVQQSQTGNYSVVVSNAVGTATSTAAVLTVNVPSTNVAPTIVSQPVSQMATVGANVAFSVAASGTGPIYYHWLYNGGHLYGQNASTLNLSQVQQSQTGKYAVMVSNPSGTTMSAAAALTVLSFDAKKQTLKLDIETPKSNEKSTNAAFTVTGKTKDDAATVTGVYYSLNGSGWTRASTTNGWTNWTANVTLNPWTNTIQAYATDSSTNVSETNTVKFTYVLKAILTVDSTLGGRVSPNYNGKLLQIGEGYSMTAHANGGFAFTNWTGSATTNGAKLEFTMASNLTFTANFVDTAAPTLKIESPKKGQGLDSSTFTVTGKAKDNVAVARVYYSLNGSAWTNAFTTNAWTNWTANVTLRPGTNTIQAYALDTTGYLSVTDSVSFIYVLTTPLTVLINGSGTVDPDYNGKLLQIGENYFMTAKPKSGITFVNWTGSATTNSTKLEFTMASNLVFTANFSDAVQPAVAVHPLLIQPQASELSKPQLSVEMLPPNISDISVIQGMATISFASQTNLLYTLESKDSMADTNWTVLPVSIMGTGDTMSLTDSNAPPVSRFYRVSAQAVP